MDIVLTGSLLSSSLIGLIGLQFDYIQRLTAQVSELTDRLAKTSRNSSKPPSSDGYEKPAPKSRRKKSGKKAGGQVGHKGSTLEVSDTPDRIEYHTVDRCAHCGRDLSDVEAESHACRQEVDIEPASAVTTEHRAEVKRCPLCEGITTASLPAHLTQAVQYGPEIKALAVYFNQYHFIPYDRLGTLFEDCYGLSISVGSLVTFTRQCADHVAPSIAAIESLLIKGPVTHFDESGMRVNGKLHWLHVASTLGVTYYTMHAKRGQEAIEAMAILPQCTGTVVHDHWAPYWCYDQCVHGLCNAHHLRELEFVAERYQQAWATELTAWLLTVRDDVAAHKEQGQTTLDAKSLATYDEQYDRLLDAGKEALPTLPVTTTPSGKRGKKKQHKAKNLWDRLREYKHAVLLFMRDFNVPFTNNLAEQDVRMCKVKAKVSGSFRSQHGAEAFCNNRSYLSTARKQNQPMLPVLRNAFLGKPFIPT